jgi:ATP-dependent DNA helicase RecQ
VQEFFIEGSNPTPELIRRVYQLLQNLANTAGEVVLSVKDLSARIDSENNDMAVHSAITILDRAGVIDRYDIPGKRIRGTRLLKRELSAFQLPIDNKALREKEKRDRAKLKSVVDYAYGRECRQKLILRYFGDPDLTDCGACDICASKRSKKLRAATSGEWLIVRKALSGVARLSTRSEKGYLPRFGRNRVIQMLVGSKSKEVLDAGFDQLKSYGALKEKSPNYLHELFHELEEAGLIYSTGGQYPTIGLTDRGIEVMHDRATIEIVWPQEVRRVSRKKAKAEQMPQMPFDLTLYDELKKVRTTMAAAQGGLPPYLIFPDETLKEFARLKPQSIDAARRIRGVGEVKAQRYLPPFLEAIRGRV